MYCDSGICYSSYTISDKKYKEKKNPFCHLWKFNMAYKLANLFHHLLSQVSTFNYSTIHFFDKDSLLNIVYKNNLYRIYTKSTSTHSLIVDTTYT